MKSKIQIGRILFFNELLFSSSVVDNSSVEKTVSEYQHHTGIDYVVYVLDPECQIIIRSTGNQIPDVEIIEARMQLGFPRSLRFNREVEGNLLTIDYSASRLREIISTLGMVEKVPKDAKLDSIELAISHYSDVRADFDRYEDYFDDHERSDEFDEMH